MIKDAFGTKVEVGQLATLKYSEQDLSGESIPRVFLGKVVGVWDAGYNPRFVLLQDESGTDYFLQLRESSDDLNELTVVANA